MRLADDVGPTAESLLPRRMAQDDDAGAAGAILAAIEVAAERGHDTERAEEAVAHARARDQLA